jgi:hypothetical protein
MPKENEKKTRYKRGENPNSRKNLKMFSTENQPESNGRPEGSRSRSTIAKKWLEVESDFKNPMTKQTEKMSVEDAMTLSMISAVLTKQNVQAYNALKDEVYGKINDTLDIGNKDGQPFEATIRVIKPKVNDDDPAENL